MAYTNKVPKLGPESMFWDRVTPSVGFGLMGGAAVGGLAMSLGGGLAVGGLAAAAGFGLMSNRPGRVAVERVVNGIPRYLASKGPGGVAAAAGWYGMLGLTAAGAVAAGPLGAAAGFAALPTLAIGGAVLGGLGYGIGRALVQRSAGMARGAAWAGVHGMSDLAILGLQGVRSTLGLAENLFVGATNALTWSPFDKKTKWARGFESAVENLFPGRGNPDIFHGLDAAGVEKLVTPEFYKSTFKGLKGEAAEFISESFRDDIGKNLRPGAEKAFANLKTARVGKNVVLGTHEFDTRRLGMNPSVIRRLTAGTAVVSALTAGVGGLMNHAPAPTVYFDGLDVRQANDMGAGGQYARAVMGRNTNL